MSLVEGGGLSVSLERVQSQTSRRELLCQPHQRRADASALILGRDEDLVDISPAAPLVFQSQKPGDPPTQFRDEYPLLHGDLVLETPPPLSFRFVVAEVREPGVPGVVPEVYYRVQVGRVVGTNLHLQGLPWNTERHAEAVQPKSDPPLDGPNRHA